MFTSYKASVPNKKEGPSPKEKGEKLQKNIIDLLILFIPNLIVLEKF